MLLCMILFWPSKIENFWIEMQNMFEVWEFKDNWLKILFLRNLGSKQVFLRAFHLILMHFIHKILCFEEFLHKIALFFKKLCFPDFRSVEFVSWPIENAIKFFEFDRFDRCSIAFESIEGIFDWSNIIFDQSKIS